MRPLIVVLLIHCQLFAQKQPISESNYFVYDKYNYGVSLNNLNANPFESPNGEIVVSEYSGHIYKISNTSVRRALPELKEKNPQLFAFFKFKNGIEYYCSNHEILVAKNNKLLKRFKLNSKNDFSENFVQYNGKIYFQTSYSNEKYQIRSFDGVVVEKVLDIRDNSYRTGYELFATDKLYFIQYSGATINVYTIEEGKQIYQKSYKSNYSNITVTNFTNTNLFAGAVSPKSLYYFQNGTFIYFNAELKAAYTSSLSENNFTIQTENNTKLVKLKTTGIQELFNTSFPTSALRTLFNKETNSFFAGTNTSFLRFFPHIKKYPRLFNNSNSASVFTLVQKNNGEIWAGSYNGFLTVIDKNETAQSKLTDFMFMNGGLAYKDKVLLFAESLKGALLFSNKDNFRKIVDSATFFYAYKSKNNVLYLGSSAKGMFYTPIKNLDNDKPIKWQIIDDKKGLSLYNIITICEDKFGNIWTGRTSQGIAVYNPKTKKAKTFSTEKKEIDFGAMSMVLDDKNTLWIGTGSGGLCYYDGKHENDLDVKNFSFIKHPLLKNDFSVAFLKQWKNYLIIGVKEKILLFNLEEWYHNKNVIVRYLNVQETNFTTPVEQNSCLIDFRDESIWFSSGDQVYNWDIKKWLSLPTFKVTPEIIIKKDSTENRFKSNSTLNFKPTENSFDLEVHYQTKDNLPRYLNGILVEKNETPVFDEPNLTTHFTYKNLSAGEYIFYLRVCQQDGSVDFFKYPIFIDSFIWQKWWFWLLVSLIPISFITYYFKKNNEIERTKKKLSQLNLASLSNQFRPHFMLNALNSIGAEMKNMPHAEKVLSRIGESVNLLYDFTQKNQFAINFTTEWKLVENSIEIQKLLFIPNLETTITGLDVIAKDIFLPVGLLQIPIENALLHGLRNKAEQPYKLSISFFKRESNYHIHIEDNGVGRERSKKMLNFRKNGRGLETLYAMIAVINKAEPNTIKFTINDLPNHGGTLVKIVLKPHLNYDKLNL